MDLSKILEDQADHNDKPIQWSVPKVITDDIKHAAAKKLDYIEKYGEPASEESAIKWLKSLAPLIESAKPMEEIEFRLNSMAQLLDYPTYCFTKETLKLFAEKHKFLPNFHDLSEFMKSFVQKTKNDAYRCRKILDGDRQKEKADNNLTTSDERARMAEKLAELRRNTFKKVEEV